MKMWHLPCTTTYRQHHRNSKNNLLNNLLPKYYTKVLDKAEKSMNQGKYLNTAVVRDGVRILTEHVNKTDTLRKRKRHIQFSGLGGILMF